MEFIEATLITFLSVVGSFVIIAAIVSIIRSGLGRTTSLSSRFLLRVYIYTFIIAGLLILTIGVSELGRAGLASGLGKEFSYRPESVALPSEPQHPLEQKHQRSLTEQEIEELDRIREERRRRQEEQGLQKALEVGLIRGAVFTAIGTIIWVGHLLARTLVESTQELGSLLNRIYLVILVVIFGIITIFHLPQSLYATSRFYLLGENGAYGSLLAGEALSLSIIALIIWIAYLPVIIRAIRSSQ